VQEAKRQLYGTVGIDGVEGPSELAILADASANPRYLALDLQAQAEHGPDSLVVLASDDADLLDAVEILLGEVAAPVALVLSETLEDAVGLVDELAPEHVQIACDGPKAAELAGRLRSAGCVFTGHNGATAFGDYVAGSNHVLPTGGAARFTSALSVAQFMRRTSIVEIPDAAVEPLAQAGAAIADAEGFTAHAASMRDRAGETAGATGEG
jgi:histidinol dehydrogenase